MSELVAQRVPLPSSWGLPQQAQGVSAGRQQVARYLRQASRAVGSAVAHILPDAGTRVTALHPGPWEGPDAVTPGPAGWFALAVEANGSGFQLGRRMLGSAELARAIWHCPRWRGRPVLLVVQASAPADGAGPVLRQLAVDLGAPVYASDAGIRFTFGRAFAGGQFWCWRPGGLGEPEPAGRLLPPLGPVRAHHMAGRHAPSPAPSLSSGPVPPPVVPAATGPAVTDPPAGTRGLGSGETSGVAALEVRGLTIPPIEVPQIDLGIRRVVLPEFPPPQLELGTCRPVAATPIAAAAPAPDPTPAAAVAAAGGPLVSDVDAAATPSTVDTDGAPAVTLLAAAVRPDLIALPDLVARAEPMVQAARIEPAVPPVARSGRSAADWFGVRARTDESDRERLRTVLGWKFQAHSRAVARALSLHPGLRSAVGAHDVLAGLVAVLALLDGVGERVNDALRGGGTPDEDVQLLARCACAGLVQLPAFGGPVFAEVPAGPVEVAGRYHSGDLVVEPAFTAVSLTGGTDGAAGQGAIRYAIWSATARRLDQLSAQPGAPARRAMFAAGTRFTVLGAEDGRDGVPWVLLREIVFEHRDGGLDERVTAKLRAVLAGQPQPAPAPSPWPLGFASGGRPFVLDPGPAGALRPDRGGPAGAGRTGAAHPAPGNTHAPAATKE